MNAAPPSTAPAPFRVLIVDDEPIARHRVKLMLAGHPDIDGVTECSDGNEVLVILEEVKPNLIFLDIQMPHLSGFETLSRMKRADQPAVVFITAYEHFARQAFDVQAIDYLVKPLSQQRFDAALERARVFVAGRRSRGGTAARAATARGGRVLTRLAVRTRQEVIFVPTLDIVWIGAEENYARLYVADRSHLIRESLQYLDANLDPSVFVRVHRSAIVNLTRMRKLVLNTNGCSIVLENGLTLPVGAHYRERLETALGSKF